MMLTMNSGQYHPRSQINRSHLGVRYGENPMPSLQSAHQILPVDGLPRTQSDQHFMNTSSSALAVPASNYGFTAQITAMPQAPTFWGDSTQMPMGFDDQTMDECYNYSNNFSATQQDTNYNQGGMNYSNVPRTSWQQPYGLGMPNENNNQVDLFEYTVNIGKDEIPTTSSPSALGFGIAEDPQALMRSSLSHSPNLENDTTSGPYDPAFSKHTPLVLPTSEESDDGGRSSREMTAMDVDDCFTIDEPYAKLIHRALMSAPNHSMILQEIYQWFRENTVKGSANSKGWQNSIRHNLSMNAAFKKTERKVGGDEIKKSTEWVLEDFAIQGGVQSTTRYRKGTGARKSMKSDNSIPARQSSGRKGGISASKTKLQRQRRDERPDPRRSLQRHDVFRSQYPHQVGSHMTHSDGTPSTPPSQDDLPSSDPYSLSKAEHPYEDEQCLENVQGVYVGGPLFGNNTFHNYPSYDGLP